MTKSILSRAHVPALLITDLTNIRYLTGMALSAGYVLIRPSGMTLYADDRYLGHAKKAARQKLRVKETKSMQADVKRLKRCAVEAMSLTLSQDKALKRIFPAVRFIQTTNIIEECRRTKNIAELRNIRKACDITLAILDRIPLMLKSGMTERDVAWEIQLEAHRCGAEDMAFETIVAFGEHTAHPHHRPTLRRFKRGDIVQIDMGVKVDGYCSDYSRVYFTKPATAMQKRALTALVAVHQGIIPLLKPGITNHVLDAKARSILKRFGYEKEFSHALGHGVGLEIHEGVILSSRGRSVKLKKNEVITIEPGLYIPGSFGMRLEDTHVIH